MTIRELWRNYIQSGIEEGLLLQGEVLKFTLVNTFSIIGVFSFIFLGFIHFFWGSVYMGGIEIFFGIVGIFNIVTLRLHKNVKIASTIIMVLMLLTLVILFLSGGYNGTGIFWIYTFPILAFALNDKREGLIWISSLFFVFLMIWFLGNISLIKLPFVNIEIFVAMFNLMVVSILIYFYQNIDEENSFLLMKKEEELSRLNEKMKQELQKGIDIKKKLENLVDESNDIRKAVLNILEDVQEEKQKFEQISARFDRATKSAKIGVWEWDPVSNTIDANEEFFGLYSVSRGTFKNAYEAWMGYVHPEDKEKVALEVKDSLASKPELNLIVRVILSDGRVHYFKILSKINRSEDGSPINLVGVQWDITKEKEAEKAISEFVSLASHQLRTPMTAISWVAEMISKKENLTEKGKKYLADIMLSIKRLTSLVDTLLNVSRIDEGRLTINPQPTEIVSSIKSYLFECEPFGVAKELNITFNSKLETLEVVTDSTAFRNILQAIVSNAIEYTPRKGKIDIFLEDGGENFNFRIKDTGIGIPKLEQGKIFSKFARASNAQLVKTDGTGLGMYIAWQAVNLLGGSIRFESEENKGTTFFVTLPKVSKSVSKKGQAGKSFA